MALLEESQPQDIRPEVRPEGSSRPRSLPQPCPLMAISGQTQYPQGVNPYSIHPPTRFDPDAGQYPCHHP